jgi:hypothetical protein
MGVLQAAILRSLLLALVAVALIMFGLPAVLAMGAGPLQ